VRRAPQRAWTRAAALPRFGGLDHAPADLLRRLRPGRRSLAASAALLALVAGVYLMARETSAFALRNVVVVGSPQGVRDQVRAALAPLVGTSLVSLDGHAVEQRLEALPTVVGAEYDRAFPHTLRVTIVPERPAAVVRSGVSAWLVSARARIMTRLPRDSRPSLPRIWLPSSASPRPGSFLSSREGRDAAEALALAARFPVRVQTASFAHGELVFRLRSGLELELGDPGDVRLKLAVARRALAAMPPGMTYLDVSLPGRPVAGAGSPVDSNPQVSSQG